MPETMENVETIENVEIQDNEAAPSILGRIVRVAVSAIAVAAIGFSGVYWLKRKRGSMKAEAESTSTPANGDDKVITLEDAEKTNK